MIRPLFVFLFLSPFFILGQTPKVTTKAEDAPDLKLQSLDISVEIVGNFATTTYDMSFYNETDRELEGELQFPLGQGQHVSRFALEINESLREAVVVEKERARVAYENTIRRRIDPALLEKTSGNNYKARVYPILPKQSKRIVLTYEQELSTQKSLQTYELPLGITEKLTNFKTTISIAGKNRAPRIQKGGLNGTIFYETQTGYIATFNATDFKPEAPVIIDIQNPESNASLLTYNNYFYYYKPLAPKTRLKEKPSEVTLLWDTSYSLRNRDLATEIQVLDDYFKYLKNVTVNFILFGNKALQPEIVKVENGDWSSIKNQIKKVNYDGGTDYTVLNLLKRTDEILLFSDGLANLGDIPKKTVAPVFAVNSTVSANHSVLQTFAEQSGGNYLNLHRLSPPKALNLLKSEPYQFLGTSHPKTIREVYPSSVQNVNSDFSLSGYFSEAAEIELRFGYGGKITDKIVISISSSENTNSNSVTNKMAEKLWAKEKLRTLQQNKTHNKDKIIFLSKEYDFVTDYTSMIVLDRVEDYAQYEIEPPKELQEQYKTALARFKKDEALREEQIRQAKDNLSAQYNELLTWYSQDFSKAKITAKSRDANQNSPEINENNNTNEVTQVELDESQPLIRGTVTDESGLVLPGVNVIIKNTSRGTQTDFDGNFAINAEEGDELEFSYVGFEPQNITVRSLSSISIQMEPGEALNEVVVTAMAVRGQRSVMASQTESLETLNQDMALEGKVQGVTIEQGTQTANQTASNPLYVLDGKVVAHNPLLELKTNEISEIQSLGTQAAISLFGNKAKNGLLIVTTKKGLKTKATAIEALNKKIENDIELKPWNPNTPYLKKLKKAKNPSEAYLTYFDLRKEYANNPSFYLDVADFFYAESELGKATKILTNLLEVELDNYELLKAMAYKVEAWGQNELAVQTYQKILELRPEEPQSYRDLALAFKASGEYQKAFDLLNKIVSGQLYEQELNRSFPGIERIAFTELCNLYKKHKDDITTSKEAVKKLKSIPVDIRITLDWNHDNTDIDLWVFDPNGEKAFYSNSKTKIGGNVSTDNTIGYGPESFMLKDAIKGIYRVKANYYGDNKQKISGPAIVKVTLFKNYGKENEEKKTTVLRLSEDKQEFEVATLLF